MAYIAPSTRSAGALITATIWNQDVVANVIAIYGGAMSIASQAAGDAIYAVSATQLGRIANTYGVLKFDGAGGVSIGPASNLRCDDEAAGRAVLPVGVDKWVAS